MHAVQTQHELLTHAEPLLVKAARRVDVSQTPHGTAHVRHLFEVAGKRLHIRVIDTRFYMLQSCVVNAI